MMDKAKAAGALQRTCGLALLRIDDAKAYDADAMAADIAEGLARDAALNKAAGLDAAMREAMAEVRRRAETLIGVDGVDQSIVREFYGAVSLRTIGEPDRLRGCEKDSRKQPKGWTPTKQELIK